MIKNNKELHETLFELRTIKGYNQTEIANVLGIRQQTYSTYEKGYNDIPTRHLLKLSNFYDVDIDYLLGNSTSRDDSIDLNVPFTAEYTIGEFLALCLSLKGEDRNTLYDMASFLNRNE